MTVQPVQNVAATSAITNVRQLGSQRRISFDRGNKITMFREQWAKRHRSDSERIDSQAAERFGKIPI